MPRPDLKPFGSVVRVTGDPAGGAFYGWHKAGWARQGQTVQLLLPAPSPSGLIWTCRAIHGLRHWEVPRQTHHGRHVVLQLPARTCLIAAGPRADDEHDRPMPSPPVGNIAPSSAGQRIVVLAGQHPGEDPALRVARRLEAWSVSQPVGDAGITVVPLANPRGRHLGTSRETTTGVDPNRSWHVPGGDAGFDEIRRRVATADFVLDIHADEYADRPYLAAPVPLDHRTADRIEAFAGAFRHHYPHALRRPKAIGVGEDHPGILINWLAHRGIAGLMLELPMRLARTRRGASLRDVSALETKVVLAVQRALTAVAAAGHRKDGAS